MQFKSLAVTTVAGAFVASGTLIAPAIAHVPPEPWYQYNAKFPDSDTVHLTAPTDDGSAYVYNDNINYPVQAGDVVSFYMDTQGQTTCTNYYPHVYVVVDGRAFASYDDGAACPGDTTTTQNDGRVSFTIPETGLLGYAQVSYYDADGNGSGGVVEISDLRVNDEVIRFYDEPVTPPAKEYVATRYDAALSKPRPCVVNTFAFLDAPLENQVATPGKRQFITRVDGVVRSSFTVFAGDTGHASAVLRPRTGKHIIAVRLANGELLDRTEAFTGHCPL